MNRVQLRPSPYLRSLGFGASLRNGETEVNTWRNRHISEVSASELH